MKKILPLSLIVLALSPTMLACSSQNDYEPPVQPVEAREEIPTPAPVEPPAPERRNIEIVLDGGFTFGRLPVSGVRRRFFDLSGNYSIEYVHTPYGMPKDDTLEYTIEMNGDNTYTMTVVSDGVKSEHSGRWYDRCGSVTFYYDEQIDPPAHNEYVCDCMFAEVLPQNKLMIYDGGRTIVLAKSATENA